MSEPLIPYDMEPEPPGGFRNVFSRPSFSDADAAGRFLDAILNPDPQPGPPWMHFFAVEEEPEAVITRLGWFFYHVNIHHGLTAFTEGWTCYGKRHAESKARRELRKYKRVPYGYTITS